MGAELATSTAALCRFVSMDNDDPSSSPSSPPSSSANPSSAAEGEDDVGGAMGRTSPSAQKEAQAVQSLEAVADRRATEAARSTSALYREAM